jgi:hypothetical protein
MEIEAPQDKHHTCARIFRLQARIFIFPQMRSHLFAKLLHSALQFMGVVGVFVAVELHIGVDIHVRVDLNGHRVGALKRWVENCQ